MKKTQSPNLIYLQHTNPLFVMKNIILKFSYLFALLTFSQGVFASGLNNGNTCINAQPISIGDTITQYFDSSRTNLYLEFTANSNFANFSFDSLGLSNIEKVLLYEFNSCSSLDTAALIYYTDSAFIKNSLYLNLNNDSTYMLHLVRKNNQTGTSTIEIYTENSFLAPCTPITLTCGELIKNGDFQSTTSTDISRAFNSNKVCYWDYIFGTPELFVTNGEQHAKMWSEHTQYGGFDGEGIITDANLIANQEYTITFRLAKWITNGGSFSLPDEFRFGLVKSSVVPTQNYNKYPSTFLAINNNIQYLNPILKADMQSDIVGTGWYEYSICFTPNDNYDKIFFYPYDNNPGTPQRGIYLDKVKLGGTYAVPGPDQTITDCSPVQLGPECPIAGANYIWSPTTGLDNAYIPNPKAFAGTTTTYTLTVVLPGTNCSDSKTVTVNNTGNYTNMVVVPDETTTGQLKNLLGLPNSTYIISNETFYISEDLRINQDIHFVNCTFLMNENARIEVKNGAHLYLDHNTVMTTCDPDKYWNGILVRHESSKLSITDGNYSNANTAITIKNGATAIIQNGDFENNKKSIQVNSNSGNAHSNRLDISNNTFKCTKPLIDDIGNEFYPMFAIKIIEWNHYNNTNHLELQMNSNTFEGSAGSVYIYQSDAKVTYNTFIGFNNKYNFGGSASKSEISLNIQGYNYDPLIPLPTTSVSVNTNYFIDNETSIFARRSIGLTIDGNFVNYNPQAGNYSTILEHERFIDLRQNTANPVISGNYIYNVESGIYTKDNYNLLIDNNTFDMETQSNPSFYTSKNNKNSLAIYVNNDGLVNLMQFVSIVPTVTISNNAVKHSKVGIQSTFTYSNITDNEILDMNDDMVAPSSCFPYPNPCPPIAPFGIRAQNDKNFIQGNKVENDLSQYSTQPHLNTAVVGISVENAANAVYPGSITEVHCNKVKNTGIGLKFNGNCDASTEVLNNYLANHYFGFVLDNSADIGNVGSPSGAAGNTYNWTPSVGSHTYNFSYANGANPTHYITSYSVFSLSGNDAAQNYNEMLQSITTNPNSVTCSPLPLTRKPDTKGQNALYQNKSGGYSVNRWMQKGAINDSAFALNQQLMFHQLSKDTALFNSKQWKPFVDSMKNTALGRSMNRNTQSNIVLANNFDRNVQTISAIVAKHAKDSILSASDLNTLRQVAVLCPYYDGIAVYQARAILLEYGNPPITNECEIIRVKSKQKGNRKQKSMLEGESNVEFKIYPNPTNSLVNIEYKVENEQEIIFELYDVVGKKKVAQSLNEGLIHRIDIKEIQTGIYFYRLIQGNSVLENGKLIVQ